jgi:hypothetical protein
MAKKVRGWREMGREERLSLLSILRKHKGLNERVPNFIEDRGMILP